MVEFDLDLNVIKAKLVSLSKKPCLVVSIASPGSFQFSQHDLRVSSCARKMLKITSGVI